MLDVFLPLSRRISHHARGIRRGAGVPTPAPWAGIARSQQETRRARMVKRVVSHWFFYYTSALTWLIYIHGQWNMRDQPKITHHRPTGSIIKLYRERRSKSNLDFGLCPLVRRPTLACFACKLLPLDRDLVRPTLACVLTWFCLFVLLTA